LGFLAAVVATTVAVAAGATAAPLWALAVLIGVVLGIAAISTPGATIATAAAGWAMYSGFVLGRHGDLALTSQSTRDAAVLAAIALLGTLVAALVRALRSRVRTGTVAIPAPRSALHRARSLG
jgi:hypothetical protein